MTDIFDKIRIGQAPPPPNANAQVIPQYGASTSPVYVYTTVPAVAANNQIALAQTVSGANFTLTAGSGASLVNIPPGGPQYIDLGNARVLQYVGSSASTAAVAITVNGLEETVLGDGTLGPGRIMTETVTGPAGSTIVTGKKAFRFIGPLPTGVRAATNTVSSVAIGTTDNYGIPYIGADAGFVEFFWNGAQETTSTRFTLPDTTSPATATTGDVRGTFLPASAATGTRRFTAYIYINNPDTSQGVYGVTNFGG